MYVADEQATAKGGAVAAALKAAGGTSGTPGVSGTKAAVGSIQNAAQQAHLENPKATTQQLADRTDEIMRNQNIQQRTEELVNQTKPKSFEEEQVARDKAAKQAEQEINKREQIKRIMSAQKELEDRREAQHPGVVQRAVSDVQYGLGRTWGWWDKLVKDEFGAVDTESPSYLAITNSIRAAEARRVSKEAE
jgi:flagellar biosynthesis GTPase FlhF